MKEKGEATELKLRQDTCARTSAAAVIRIDRLLYERRPCDIAVCGLFLNLALGQVSGRWLGEVG